MGGGVQRGDACGFGGELALLFEGVAQALVHGDGDAAVDFGAGDLFEQRRAFVRCSAEEGGEVALGEEHSAGEALVVHAGEAFDGGGDVFEAGGEEFAAFGVGQFVFGVLEFAACFAPRAVLAPVAAVAPVRVLKVISAWQVPLWRLMISLPALPMRARRGVRP